MSTRTKEKAAENEDKDVAFIVAAIHAKNQTGNRFLASFKEKFGCDILDARPRPSPRKNHYDFDILVRFPNGEELWKHVEHKGSTLFRQIKPDEKYWAAAVQFHNGGCDKYSIAKSYARVHYDTHIASGSLKNTFGIIAPIPSYDDWFKQDCCVQADPRSAFGKELKKKVRAARGPRSSLLDERESVIKALQFTDEDTQKLIKEVLPIANQVLEDKDYWLTICGNLEDGNFNLAWNPKFKIGEIKKVVIRKELDVWFDFTCSNGFTFSAHLRWGKGAGFSCLRVDLKDTPTSAVADVEDD
jgi:hypothetical protein